MCKMFELVEVGEVYVCVSVGNIGVLLMFVFYVLKIFFGIDWFVLVFDMFMVSYYWVFLLDLGVNVNCIFEILF